MAYTILNTDGTTLLLLADNTVDKSATSLDLFGRNVNSYGEYLHNNLVKLTANFASSSGSPPRSPLKGQLWYDTTVKRLKVYDNGFKNVSGAIISADVPRGLSNGDMWFDSTNDQLYVVAQNSIKLVGPAFPKNTGANGWVLPTPSIKNTASNTQQVITLRSYGQFIGMASSTSFELSATDAENYFESPSNSLVAAGITLGSDLRVYGNIETTGQITNRNLSAYFDIDRISYENANVTDYNQYLTQNQIIKQHLTTLFPVMANTSAKEVGLPVGTEARVTCVYTVGVNTPGGAIQFRRFRVVNDAVQGKSWQPYNIYSVLWTTENVNIISAATIPDNGTPPTPPPNPIPSSINVTSLPVGTVGLSYNTAGLQFTSDGAAPIIWTASYGQSVLDTAGLTLSENGLLAGIPTDPVVGMVTFRATNAYGYDEKTLTLTVSTPAPTDLSNVTLTMTPLQGSRENLEITVNTWTLVPDGQIINWAGQWNQYVGTIPGEDEGVVVYMWTGPNNWRCLQVAGKLSAVLTHYSDGTTFFTDSTKTTPQVGDAPNVLELAPLKFNLAVTESGTPINWITGGPNTKKASLSSVEVHYSVPVFIFNSVPSANLTRVVDAIKEWRLFGVYTDSDLGPENSGTAPPPAVNGVAPPTAQSLPPSGLGFTGEGYSPENPAPIYGEMGVDAEGKPVVTVPSDLTAYQGLLLSTNAGDAWVGRSYYEASESQLIDLAIKGTPPADLTTYSWRLMSQALNLARVPLYCTWNDTTHRINDPQKGSTPIRRMTNAFPGSNYGIKDAYALNSQGLGNELAITHPWTGTSYLYEMTGCPVFAAISSGVLAFQISSEYAWLPKIAGNYSGYAPASMDSTTDRAESWSLGRISKLISEVPTSGRVPGAFSYAELNQMLTEMPLVPNVGMVARMAKRKAQTTPGTTINSTLVYLDQLMNFPMMTVCEYNNNPDAPYSETGGAWFSNLMFMYALENSIIHAINGRADYVNYVGDILTCFERCVYVLGRGGIYRTVNFHIGPQVTNDNKGSAYPLQTLDDIKAHRQTYGDKGYIPDHPVIYGGFNDFDAKTLICQIRMLRHVAVAAQKGKLPSAWQARAQSLRDQLLAGCAQVSTSVGSTSYGNYFGIPPALESQMITV
jgi:hypothetical protein